MAHSVAAPQWRQESRRATGQSQTSLMQPEKIRELQDAIRETHGCDSNHVNPFRLRNDMVAKLDGREELKFSIWWDIQKRNALTLGAIETVIK